ncbi:TPA: hypothetical protein RQO74_000247 [Klebsiella michiganensis]|nr:hypothetical protein [Klebsiella michiganensis]
MNEQANKILVDLLQKASSGIDAAVSFSQAQLPDIIRQLMVWKAAAYALNVIFALLLLIGCIVAFRKGMKWFESYDKEVLGLFALMFSSCGVAAACYGIMDNVTNGIQLWLAPKIWLVEYAASLVK